MHGKTVFALVGTFLSFTAAVPMNKRDVVWVTMTQEDFVTIPVTKTVWLEPGQETPEASPTTSAIAHYGHGHHTKATSTIHSTVTVKPIASSEESSAPSTYEAPTTSTSVFVAPSTSSTSEYDLPSPSSTSVYVEPTTSSSSVYITPTTSSTSVYVAPTTSSVSEYIAPPPTSTYVAPPAAPSSAAAATQTYGSGSGSSPMAGKSYTGDLTYYSTGMGACGITSGDSDHIVAISEVTFDQFTPNGNPNNNPLCGQKVSITSSNGSKYEATIVDRCTGCAAANLDLSPGFFDIVEPTGDGRVHNVDWTFV